MGDMSRCPHDGFVGYCDICSPNWEAELDQSEKECIIYEAGRKKGAADLTAAIKRAETAEAITRAAAQQPQEGSVQAAVEAAALLEGVSPELFVSVLRGEYAVRAAEQVNAEGPATTTTVVYGSKTNMVAAVTEDLMQHCPATSAPDTGSVSVPDYDRFGYALAMRVLQSDLYHNLDERERSECDELILAATKEPK